jgi:flagellar biosynthesis regulator FlaF
MKKINKKNWFVNNNKLDINQLTMPLKKSLKELSTNIYNKYVEIRNNHNQNNETIISDKSIVSSSDFVYLTLLISCEIHYTSLYK